MLRHLSVLTLVVVALAAGGLVGLPGLAAPSAVRGGPADFVVTHQTYAPDGTVAEQSGYMRYDHDLGFHRGFTHRPNHGGGAGGGGGGPDPGTDCESDSFRAAPWKWLGPYTATASSYASTFNTAGATWDAATTASIFGGITQGSGPAAGTQDLVNQLDFVWLGASSTIAVTTTWYYISTGVAVESDGQYNSFYAWGTSGAGDVMDVQAIGTHEIGHTFGLDHPTGNPNRISCLTMYAYGDYGQTHQRTLGDGDELGTRAAYGA